MLLDFLFLLLKLFPVFLIACVIYSALSDRKSRRNSSTFDSLDVSYNESPKISSVVSVQLYEEAKRYCCKHRITMSDLIRKAVRFYMDSNK